MFRNTALFVILFFFFSSSSLLIAQIPKTISYEGVIEKDGSPFSGEAPFVFTLYRGNSIAWHSPIIPLSVEKGFFRAVIGPIPDSIRFFGIDSLGISFEGEELSPRVSFSSVAYSLSSSHALFADSARNAGPPGAKGDKGDPGPQGEKGEKGDAGSNGLQGPQGLKGDKGDPGDAGSQGPQGLKGDKGDPGDAGSQGPQGLKGDKGDPGDAGSQGPQGLKGDKGDPGDAGSQGPQGLKGDKGDPGDSGTQGPQGLKGDKGDPGATGLQGPQGLKGDKGDPGIKGDKGDKGDPGSQGSKGDKGDPAYIEIISTDQTNGAIVFSLNAGTGSVNDYVKIVRTGDAGTFKVEVPISESVTANYTAWWHTVTEGGGDVSVTNGTAVLNASQQFNIGSAVHISMMMRAGSRWARIDLFRSSSSDTAWYGFSNTN